MFFDEDEQVNGMVFLADYGGAKMSHLSWIGFDNIKRLAEFVNVRFDTIDKFQTKLMTLLTFRCN